MICNVDGNTIFSTPVALIVSIVVIPSGITISSASVSLFNFFSIVLSITNFDDSLITLYCFTFLYLIPNSFKKSASTISILIFAKFKIFSISLIFVLWNISATLPSSSTE